MRATSRQTSPAPFGAFARSYETVVTWLGDAGTSTFVLPLPPKVEIMTVAIRRAALATLSISLGNPEPDPDASETFGDALMQQAVQRIRELTDGLADAEARVLRQTGGPE